MRQTSRRLKYVDLFRGIGIFLMVMGHVGFGKQFDHYIHAFHMPMFFFASGYFFKQYQPLGSFLIAKVSALIVPYLFYATTIFTLWKCIYNLPKESLFYVLAYMNSTEFIAAALWFLTALFLANCIYWALNHYISNKWILSGAIIVIALCGNLFHIYFKKPCIFALDASMVGVGMQHVGFLFRNKKQFVTKIVDYSWSTLAVGLILDGILIFINETVNMRGGEYGIIPLFWMNAIGSSILLWGLSYKLERWKTCPKVVSIFFAFLQGIGKRSLTFLCLNQLVIFGVFKVFPVENDGGIGILLHNSVSLAIVLCILYMTAYVKETLRNRFF